MCEPVVQASAAQPSLSSPSWQSQLLQVYGILLQRRLFRSSRSPPLFSGSLLLIATPRSSLPLAVIQAVAPQMATPLLMASQEELPRLDFQEASLFQFQSGSEVQVGVVASHRQVPLVE